MGMVYGTVSKIRSASAWGAVSAMVSASPSGSTSETASAMASAMASAGALGKALESKLLRYHERSAT